MLDRFIYGSTGARAVLIGAVGCDPTADILNSRLNQLDGIETRFF
jgi:hypothetical protein